MPTPDSRAFRASDDTHAALVTVFVFLFVFCLITAPFVIISNVAPEFLPWASATSSSVEHEPSSDKEMPSLSFSGTSDASEPIDTSDGDQGRAVSAGSQSIQTVARSVNDAWSDESEFLASSIMEQTCFHDVASTECSDELMRELSMVPPEMLSMFSESGWTVHVCSEPLAKRFDDMLGDSIYAGMNIYGLTLPTEHEVWVWNQSPGVIAHEMGHVLDCELGYPSGDESFRLALDTVESRAQAGINAAKEMSEKLAGYPNDKERFAAAFEWYVKSEEQLLEANPDIWEMFARMFGSHLASYGEFSAVYESAKSEGGE